MEQWGGQRTLCAFSLAPAEPQDRPLQLQPLRASLPHQPQSPRVNALLESPVRPGGESPSCQRCHGPHFSSQPPKHQPPGGMVLGQAVRLNPGTRAEGALGPWSSWPRCPDAWLRDLGQGLHLSEPQFLHLEVGVIVMPTLSVDSGKDSR